MTYKLVGMGCAIYALIACQQLEGNVSFGKPELATLKRAVVTNVVNPVKRLFAKETSISSSGEVRTGLKINQVLADAKDRVIKSAKNAKEIVVNRWEAHGKNLKDLPRYNRVKEDIESFGSLSSYNPVFDTLDAVPAHKKHASFVSEFDQIAANADYAKAKPHHVKDLKELQKSIKQAQQDFIKKTNSQPMITPSKASIPKKLERKSKGQTFSPAEFENMDAGTEKLKNDLAAFRQRSQSKKMAIDEHISLQKEVIKNLDNDFAAFKQRSQPKKTAMDEQISLQENVSKTHDKGPLNLEWDYYVTKMNV